MPTHCDLMETCEACLYSCWYVQAADYSYHCVLDLKDLGQKVKRIFSDVSNCTQVPIPLDPNVKLVMVGGGFGIFLVTCLFCCIIFGLYKFIRRQRRTRSRSQGSTGGNENIPLVTMNPMYGEAATRDEINPENNDYSGSQQPKIQKMTSFCSPKFLQQQPLQQPGVKIPPPQPPPPPPLSTVLPPPPPPRKTKLWTRDDTGSVAAIPNDTYEPKNVELEQESEAKNRSNNEGLQLSWSGVEFYPRDVASANKGGNISERCSPTYGTIYGQDYAQMDEIPL